MTNDLLTLILICAITANVLVAVLGILVTGYNRRQAQALDLAREALESFVIHQKKVHREGKAGMDLIAGNAVAWVAEHSQVPVQTVLRVLPDVQAVELQSVAGVRVVVAPHPAHTLRAMTRPGQGRLAQALQQPLLTGGARVTTLERSPLNAGDYFDIAAQQAAAQLGVSGWGDRLYFHVVGG